MDTAKMRSHSRALLVGIGLAGVLAACSSPSANGQDGERFDYADGQYEATGTYQSPNGTETLGVAVTLDGNVITDVDITIHPNDEDEVEEFQGRFAGGIAEVVVGKNIDEIQVDKVAGSSLTSGGFKDAISQIKADAAE